MKFKTLSKVAIAFSVALTLAISAQAADTTKLVNVDDNGMQGTGGINYQSDITANGKEVVFFSVASDLVPGESAGIFIRNLETEKTTKLFTDSKGIAPQISASGQFVVFLTYEPLVAPDTNPSAYGQGDFYRYDRWNDVIELVSINSAETESQDINTFSSPKISPNGRFVLFSTAATNLVDDVVFDVLYIEQLYVRDMDTKTTVLVSVNLLGDPGNNHTRMGIGADVNDNGDVVFASSATNIVSDVNLGISHVFLRKGNNPDTGTALALDGPILVDRSTNDNGDVANRPSSSPLLTADGRVLFVSGANNLDASDPNDFNQDRFLRSVDGSSFERVNLDNDGNYGGPLGGPSAAISPDGKFVTFIASNQYFFNSNVTYGWNVFTRDLDAGVTKIVSLRDDGTRSGATYDYTYESGYTRTFLYLNLYVSMSNDGATATFASQAPDLIVSDDDVNHKYGCTSLPQDGCSNSGGGQYDLFVRLPIDDPAEQTIALIEELVVVVVAQNLDLNNGLGNKLLTSLEDVNKQIEKDHIDAAIDQLNDFIDYVIWLEGKGRLTQAQADSLTGTALVIIDTLMV